MWGVPCRMDEETNHAESRCRRAQTQVKPADHRTVPPGRVDSGAAADRAPACPEVRRVAVAGARRLGVSGQQRCHRAHRRGRLCAGGRGCRPGQCGHRRAAAGGRGAVSADPARTVYRRAARAGLGSQHDAALRCDARAVAEGPDAAVGGRLSGARSGQRLAVQGIPADGGGIPGQLRISSGDRAGGCPVAELSAGHAEAEAAEEGPRAARQAGRAGGHIRHQPVRPGCGTARNHRRLFAEPVLCRRGAPPQPAAPGGRI